MDLNYENLNDLHITISAAFRDGLAAAPPSEWQRVATRMGSSSNHNVYPFMGELPSMRRWVGDLIAHQLKSYRYSIENEKFELTLEGDLTQIEDDQGGMAPQYASVASAHGRAVAVQPDELVMGEALVGADSNACYDGQPMVDDSHPSPDGSVQSNEGGGSGTRWFLMDTTKIFKPLIYQERKAPQFVAMDNLQSEEVFKRDKILWKATRRNAAGYGLWQTIYGSKLTLNETNFVAARLAMNGFVNDVGRNMGINPNLLVVPRSLQDVARKLFGSEYLSVTGGSTENNYLKGAVEIMVSNYI